MLYIYKIYKILYKTYIHIRIYIYVLIFIVHINIKYISLYINEINNCLNIYFFQIYIRI